MEPLNPQVVTAAKLPILNPNEFDLWKIRIDQYFLMTDYSLWEVILNGDSPPPTRIVDGVVQIVASTTAEQRLAKKNKLKARRTLLMSLPDKHQLKFNIYKDAKSLMEAIEKRFGEWKTHTLIWRNKVDLKEQSLDDLFNNLMINEAEVKGSSPSSQNTQNIAFVSSNNTDNTNDSVNAASSISAASFKAKVSTLPNVDTLSDAVIYSFFESQSTSPQLDNEDLKQINLDDLEEIDLKWQMAMLTIRAKRFFKRTGKNLVGGYDWSFQADEEPTNYTLMAYTSSGLLSSSGSDNEVAPCFKACSKGYATLQTHYDNSTVKFRKSQLDVLSYKTGLESVEARLVVYQKNETVFEDNIKLLKFDVMLRDNALAELRKKFEKAKKERNYLKLTLDKFQTSSKNLGKLLESQVSDKTGLGFDSQVLNCQVSDCKELHSHESDNRVPKNLENDRYKTGEGYHAVPPLYTETFLPPKPNLVFTDDPNASESVANISDSKDKTEIESVPKQREPSFVTSTKHVKSSRESVKKVKHHKQAANLKTNTQKSRGHKKNWNNKAYFVCRSLNHLIKDCDYYEKQMVQKPMWNNAMRVNHQNSVRMTHPYSNRNVVPIAVLTRSRLVSLNAVRPVPTAVTQSTVKVHGQSNMLLIRHIHLVTRVMLKKPQYTGCGNQNGNPHQALKDKDVIDSGCSRHMAGNISFLSEFEEINGGYVAFRGILKVTLNVLFCLLTYKLPDENHVLLRVLRENNMYNVDLNNVVPSGGIRPKWLFDIDTLTMSMNYQPVVAGNQPNDNVGIKENHDIGKVGKETVSAQQYMLLPLWSTGSQDPHNTDADVADAAFDVKENGNDVYISTNGKFSFNSSNRVNAVSAPVNAAGPNLTNSSNSFDTTSPSVDVVSLNFRIARKSSFVDPSKYPNDPDMLELEDIVYSYDEEDVGAEADLSSLETNILISLIPTTRVHKDHPINQIISNLNSAPQTRSITRMVKEQGGLHQINDEDFYNYMFAYFISQEEPKKVLQSLKDPSWIEAMQEELLQFKLQKVWVLIDLPKGKRAIGSKLVFRNKKDERGIVIKNKARLVSQGPTQKEGIGYDEVFALVARIEAIRLFLAYASFMGFMVYQMDVKSAFLYGTIKQEVYVCQPSGFEDPDYPDKVYKVVKALYGLHQAPRAFQVYVDDIIFGSTNKELCKAFEKLMKDKFQMSYMGELTFFLGLQLKQKDDGIFINQDKYVAKILRKFRFTDVKSASTLIETEKPLVKNPDGEDVDVHIYTGQ
nr:hypothetical protein [Tanacetum cinerariifolium]